MPRAWASIFRALQAELRRTLPAELADFSWSATGWMAKAWYGNRALHYEIWVRDRARVVEVGLHFEAEALTNARLLAAFRARAREIERGLGGDARIEEWDKGWARVWEPFASSDADVTERVRARFAAYIRVLEPILRDEVPSDVEWAATSPRSSRSGRRSGSSPRRSAAPGARTRGAPRRAASR